MGRDYLIIHNDNRLGNEGKRSGAASDLLAGKCGSLLPEGSWIEKLFGQFDVSRLFDDARPYKPGVLRYQ